MLQEALSALELSDLLGSLAGRAAASGLLDTAAGLLSLLTNARDAANLLSKLHKQDNGATILTQLLLKVANRAACLCCALHIFPVTSKID